MKYQKNTIEIKCSICGSGKLFYMLRHNFGCDGEDCCGGRVYYGFKIGCYGCGAKIEIDCGEE